MTVAYWLALQAASATAPAGLVPVDFDLARLRRPLAGPVAAPRCASGDATAIVVCGRRSGGGYPLAEWARIFPPDGPLRAETSLGDGATGRIHAESVALDRGAVSQRAMIGVAIRF